MKALVIAAAVTLLAAAGCKQEQPEPEPAPAAVPTQTAAPAVEQPATAVPDDLPTVEDFEEEAAEDITVDNMEEELDRLEAEIGG